MDSVQLKLAHLDIAAPPARAAGREAPPAFIAGAAGAAPAASGPDQATLNAAARSTDWLFHSHDYGGTRFSPLQDINASNAARLAPVCMFQMGERDNFQTGPIVYNGTMYVTTMTTTVALDAATCRLKWRHTWEPRDDRGLGAQSRRRDQGRPRRARHA